MRRELLRCRRRHLDAFIFQAFFERTGEHFVLIGGELRKHRLRDLRLRADAVPPRHVITRHTAFGKRRYIRKLRVAPR